MFIFCLLFVIVRMEIKSTPAVDTQKFLCCNKSTEFRINEAKMPLKYENARKICKNTSPNEAILAAVLIPTFSSIVQKARESSALQAARTEMIEIKASL